MNTVLPSVSGTAEEGKTLSASTGTWSGSPTSYAYQWEDCNALGEGCSSVSGAMASSYKLAAGDVGHTVRVVVSATNEGGSTPASSAATAVVVSPPPPVVPVNTVLPSVSGTAEEGKTLSASTGTWSGSPTSYAYQWEDCNALGEGCSSVSGAMASSYKLAAGDVGHTVRVVVSATNEGGSTPASSAATAVVVSPPPPVVPVNTVLPSVSGTAEEGKTLSASTGTWSGSPTSYAYQWEDCNALGEGCSSVSGAMASSYKLAAGDVGHTVRVVVSATNEGGSTPASSAATAVVVSPPPPVVPVNTVLPSVSGTAEEGKTLSASTGTWSGSPTSYAYQWEDCNALGEGCSSVSGAMASSYKLAAGDVGHTVRVVVSATNEGGSTPASSAATAVVVSPPPPVVPVNTVLPSVSGTAEEGKTLSASTGTWSGSPTSYAYQWEDCNALGEGCLSISGSTTASLKLTALNVGDTVRVSVTATNLEGFASATSAATPVIKAVPPPPPSEPVVLIGVKTAHHHGGDAKTEEITPVKFEAKKSGTVEEICFETAGYLYSPSETSLVLGIQEDIGGKPGKVLGEGTYIGTLGTNSEAKVTGLKVPVTKGKIYFLSFLNLGGSITYWYEKTETIIYSQHHKKLEEGPPEKYEWKEEAEEAPIGIWAKGTET